MTDTLPVSLAKHTPGQRVKIVNPYFRGEGWKFPAPEWEGFEARISEKPGVHNEHYVLLEPLSLRPDTQTYSEFFWHWYQLEIVEE